MKWIYAYYVPKNHPKEENKDFSGGLFRHPPEYTLI